VWIIPQSEPVSTVEAPCLRSLHAQLPGQGPIAASDASSGTSVFGLSGGLRATVTPSRYRAYKTLDRLVPRP
jgi:hypothetical protein